MNRIERAERILAAARARSPQACVPGRVGSPADHLVTVALSRQLIAECDRSGEAVDEPGPAGPSVVR